MKRPISSFFSVSLSRELGTNILLTKKLKIMAKNDNPFAIRKSPVDLITVQALTLDDYVQRVVDDRDGVSFCATTNKK